MQRLAFTASLALLLSACTEAPAPPGSACAGLPDDRMVWVPGGRFVMGDDPQ